MLNDSDLIAYIVYIRERSSSIFGVTQRRFILRGRRDQDLPVMKVTRWGTMNPTAPKGWLQPMKS